MNVLLDTNILGRMAEAGHPQHQVALDAVNALVGWGNTPCIVPQVIYELWVVATRPVSANGLGLTPTQAAAELSRIKSLFLLPPDTPAIYAEWERLVTVHQVMGKSAHDARLVAAMGVHGMSHILSFNVGDFARYPGITALDAMAMALPPTP
jgi:predicted nucleic acid-binding protein